MTARLMSDAVAPLDIASSRRDLISTTAVLAALLSIGLGRHAVEHRGTGQASPPPGPESSHRRTSRRFM